MNDSTPHILSSANAKEPGKLPVQVLFVDTFPVLALRERLKQHEDLAVSFTSSMKEAFEHAKQEKYDALVLNCLTGKDNLASCKELKENWSSLPLVVLASKEKSREVKQEVWNLGLSVDGYIELDDDVSDKSTELTQTLLTLGKKKRLYEDLKTKEEKFQAMVEAAKDGIVLINSSGKITFWNKAAQKIFGYTQDEAVGKTLDFLMPKTHLERYQDKEQKMFAGLSLQGKQAFPSRVTQLPGLRKDGVVIPTEMSMSALTIGDEWQGLAIIRDATERQKAENEILLQKERSRIILDSSPDAITFIDMDGVIVDCNAATENLYLYPKSEIIGKKALVLSPKSEHEKIAQAGIELVKSGIIRNVEAIGLKKTGETFISEYSGGLFKDKSGQPVGSVFIIRDITERKKAENELLLEKERSRAILDASPDAIAFIDLNGVIIDCSSAAAELLLYSKSELIGKPGLDLAFGNEREKAEKLSEQIFTKGYVQNAQIAIPKKNGEVFTAEFSASALRDKQNNPIGYVLITRDITERKKAEAALKNSEEQFRSLAENSPTMVFINQNGKVVYVNKEASAIMGYAKEEFYAPDFDFLDLIAPEFKEKVASKYRQHQYNQEIEPYECKLFAKDGSIREVIINSRTIRYNNQPAILGIVTDITESKKAEFEMAQAKERFRVYVETSPVAVFVADPEGKYQYANLAASNLLGYSQEELLNLSVPQLLFEEELPKALKSFEEVKTTGRSLSEIALRKKTGEHVYVILNSVKLPDGNLLAFCENVTERKKAEQELLLQTERLKATFAASPDAIISIDLNGKITDCNDAVLELFCYESKEQVIGKSSLSLVTESERSRTMADLRAVLEDNKIIRNKEFIGLKANGEEILIETSESTLKDANGNVSGIIATARDITERKKAEAQIRLLSSVVQQTIEGIAVSDNVGHILFVNSAWLRMHSFDEDDGPELIGKMIASFYCSPQLQSVEDKLAPDGVFRGRITQVRKDGTTFPALATLSPLKNEKGQTIGIIHMAKNLTEIVRDIRDVRSADRCVIQKKPSDEAQS